MAVDYPGGCSDLLAAMNIEQINFMREWWSRQGPPGDPPVFLCELCGYENCECGEEHDEKERE